MGDPIATVGQYAEWIDRALFIGKVALMIGAPTAFATGVFAHLAIRAILKRASEAIGQQIGKAAVRYASAKVGVGAGIVATVCASMFGGGDGQGGGVGVGVVLPVEEVQKEAIELVLAEDGKTGEPVCELDGRAVALKSLILDIAMRARHGSLKRIKVVDRLTPGRHGEWTIHLQEILALFPEIEKVTSSSGERD